VKFGAGGGWGKQSEFSNKSSYRQFRAILLDELGLVVKSMAISEVGEVDPFKNLEPYSADNCKLAMNKSYFSNMKHDIATDLFTIARVHDKIL
jgi:hypothetical protein